jgi:trypsin
VQLARFLCVLAATCGALPAAAILIRADRDDAEYLELASRYASTVTFEPSTCGGVLIAPRWVLTFALAASEIGQRKPPARLRIGKREHEVEAVFISPQQMAGLGLVLLKTPVTAVQPSPLYRDRNEAGKAVVMVSFGPTGRIGDDATRSDKQARAAINTVDGISDPLLQLRIKPPEEASDLQGAAVNEDCGSPAYIETSEGIFVAGIAWVGKSPPKVGESNFFIRVSTQVPWIEAVMLDVARKELDAMLDAERR